MARRRRRGEGGARAGQVPVNGAVERRDVEQQVSGIGTVTSLHNVVIRTQIDGQLTRLLVSEGQMVEAGELLATIDDRAVVAALEQAQASRASNQAQLKSAEQDLQRYRSLYAERAVSRQLLDQQQATVDQLRATLKANDATINAERVRLSYTGSPRRYPARSVSATSMSATWCGSATVSACSA